MLDYEVQFKEKLKNISNVTGNSIEIAIEYFDNWFINRDFLGRGLNED